MKEFCETKDTELNRLRQKYQSTEAKIKEDIKNYKKHEELLMQENQKLIKDLKLQLKETDALQKQVKELSQKGNLFLGKFEEDKILKEIKELISENENIRDYAREIKSELDYGKQRENKLMFFLYVLQQKGYPVFEIFEKNIRNVATHRFSTNLDEEYKNIYYEEQMKVAKRKH
jgi:hypothetical protein